MNENTPPEVCKVKYPDFNDAIDLRLHEGRSCRISRSDMKAAFRNLGIRKQDFWLLIMKARSPIDGKFYYFLDKCLAFGASISCSHFQRFSNCIAHILEFWTGRRPVNYLDDYLFASLLKLFCDSQVREFIELCEHICFPVNLKKTFWGTTRLTFLGLLIDTVLQMVFVPVNKVTKALQLINMIVEKKSHKVTLRQLQKVCGFLNFLSRCIVPGRAFTRRLYLSTKNFNGKLKPHHHVRVTGEMKQDLIMWKEFLSHPTIYCRPFADFTDVVTAYQVNFFSDASMTGFSALCYSNWMTKKWDLKYVRRMKLDIECLELFALVAAAETWIHKFKNRKIIVYCDNQNVCRAVNKTSTSCMKCMVLVRKLIFKCMTENVDIFAQYIKSKANKFADMLSRDQLTDFKAEAAKDNLEIKLEPTDVPISMWPMEKIWGFKPK